MGALWKLGPFTPVGVRWAPLKSAAGSDCPFKARAAGGESRGSAPWACATRPAPAASAPRPRPRSLRPPRPAPTPKGPRRSRRRKWALGSASFLSPEPGVFAPLSKLFLRVEKFSSEHLCGGTFSLSRLGLEEIPRLIYSPCLFLLKS